jgi:hypothetical protein
MMKMKSRAETLFRNAPAAVSAVACLTLLAGTSARAQSTPPRPTIRAWAGVGAGFSPAGLVGAWEAWGGMGVLGVGFQSSATDDFNGTTNLARGVLVGALLPYDHLLARVAVGSASARRCIVRGEQAAARTCMSGTRAEIALSADYVLGSVGSVHTSWFSVPSRDVGHSGLIVGLTLGRVGR